MKEIIIALVIIAIDVFAFVGRYQTTLKEKKPLDQPSMWTLYILPLVIHGIIGKAFPDMDKVISIIVLLALFVPTYFAVRTAKKMHERKLAELTK